MRLLKAGVGLRQGKFGMILVSEGMFNEVQLEEAPALLSPEGAV